MLALLPLTLGLRRVELFTAGGAEVFPGGGDTATCKVCMLVVDDFEMMLDKVSPGMLHPLHP